MCEGKYFQSFKKKVNVVKKMNTSSIILSEKFFLKISLSWTIDALYAYLQAPFSLIGLLFNIVCTIVMAKIKIQQTKLYDYLTIYSFNSALMCFMGIFSFTGFSPRIDMTLFTSILGRIDKCFIITFACLVFYFFGNLLDIIIALDRLSIFIKGFKIITKFKPSILCSGLLAFCFTINLPNLFTYYIRNDEEFYRDLYDMNNTNVFSYCGRTEYAKTLTNTIVSIIQVLIRDIITLILEIVTSALAIYYYKKFEQKFKIIRENPDIKSKVDQIKQNNANISNKQQVKIGNVSNKKSLKGKQLLLMTIILSITSSLTHLAALLVSVNGSSASVLLNYLILSTNLFLNLKYTLNFFIFYFFNLNFKNKINSMLLCNQN
jgi:hypothetical protein